MHDKLQPIIMREMGMNEELLELVWAPPVQSPPAGVEPVYVYLDINHWVSLAKARLGRADGAQFAACYQLLREGVANGRVVVPLSTTHYTEVDNIGSIRQRTDLAGIMTELSRFTTIANWRTRVGREFHAALPICFGGQALAVKPRPFGYGFSYAYGVNVVGKLVPKAPGTSLPEDITAADIAEVEFLFNRLTEYVMLRGPRPEEIPFLRDYEPQASLAIGEERARRERELAELLKIDPNAKARLDDIVRARGLHWELGDALPEFLKEAGLTVSAFFDVGKERLNAFLDAIPCLAVQRALTTQTLKNGSRAWKVNDIRDIDGLGAAVPYCDVVVTEKYASEVLNRSGVARQCHTTVIRRLEELEPLVKDVA